MTELAQRGMNLGKASNSFVDGKPRSPKKTCGDRVTFPDVLQIPLSSQNPRERRSCQYLCAVGRKQRCSFTLKTPMWSTSATFGSNLPQTPLTCMRLHVATVYSTPPGPKLVKKET